MSTKVSFADLTHTGQLVAANTFPLGISMVAAYAKQELERNIDIDIFKYPEEFSKYLENDLPTIACFSNFSWNLRLGYEYARRIKKISPETIIVFGGPNFSDERNEQEKFLLKYSSIDCYLEFEGEYCFVKLFKELKKLNFNWKNFKEVQPTIPNIHYLLDDEMISCDSGPKVEVSNLPSPYEMGLMDKFFDDTLIPMMQTARGCPYGCTFCWEGGDYFNKIKRFSENRISDDLNYIAKRVKVPDLCIVDANFGMFKQDLVTTKEILKVQEKCDGWPKTVLTATAKNHKERTIEIVELLGSTLPPTAAVQSTDDEVLENIRRKNVSLDTLIMLSKSVDKVGGQSEAELILCIEGDTKDKHFKTVFDMLDADMTFIRMYQFMMIPGTQASRTDTRAKYGMITKYRVLPRCFGKYSFRSKQFSVAEIEEIVISNNTMTYEEYKDCRDLHLTVEIFNNDSIFAELIQLLRQKNIRRSEYINEIHNKAIKDSILGKLYVDFREEEKVNLSDDEQSLIDFTEQPDVINKYISAQYGTNELYKYRVLGIFNNTELIHDIAFAIGKSLLKKNGLLTQDLDKYLDELYTFSLLRKNDLLNTKIAYRHKFHYDFVELLNKHFLIDPRSAYVPSGIEIDIFHSELEIDLIDDYTKQYGTDIIGLSRIVLRANLNRLYRTSTKADTKGKNIKTTLRKNKRSNLKLIT